MGKSILSKVALTGFLLFPAIGALPEATLSAKIVKGTVISATDGEPLIGASVKVVGSQAAAITDLDGNFTIDVNNGQTLTISYVGFVDQKVRVNGDVVKVSMKEEANSLNDVVVIGYGVQKKKLVTGATTQLKGEDVAKLNTNNALQAMQGQTPGVNIISESGQPGSGMKVIIRGQGSNISNSPLYVVDGIAGVDISNINPSDIESIDVLKDAASAAIYGAQAANGVVLVTTRSGSAGKAQVTFDGYMGWQSAAHKINMCNAQEYMTLMDEQSQNSGAGAIDWSKYSSIYTYQYDADGNITGKTLNDTNWMDEMFKDNAKQQSYTIGVNGGSKDATYAISLGYYSQEGIVGGKDASNYERYNFRANLQQKLYKNLLTIGENVSLAYVDQKGIGTGNMYNNTLRGAYGATPLLPVYLQNDGRADLNNGYSYSIASDWYQYDYNPVAALYRNHNKSDNQNWVANVFAELQPIKNLKIRTQLGFNHNSSSYRSYTPAYTATTNSSQLSPSVSQSMYKGWTLTWTNTASYNWKIKDHEFNTMLGMEAERFQGDNLSGNNTLMDIYNDWAHAYLSNAVDLNAGGLYGYPSNDYRRVSYFGRIGWNWKDTYMLNATLRADGSSRFAENHRWGWFPSVSAGWVITNEKWMQGINKYMDFLKIRASWGQVGNNAIGDYLYAAPVTLSGAGYNFGTGKGTDKNTNGAYAYRLGNDNLKWETSEQTDLGFDARFLQSRLGVNFDWYYKKTKDWIVQAPVIATAGADAPYINGGDVENKGIEVNFTWNDHIGKAFKYNLGANFAYNKNKVGNVATVDGIIHGSTNVMFNNQHEFYRISNGHAMGYFWGYQTAGVFQNQQQINDWIAAGNGIKSGTQPGDAIFVDQNHDGVIDDNDKVDLGNGIPKWNFGFNVGCSYKHFDFSMVWTGMAGFKVANGGYRNWGNADLSNYTTKFLSRWTGEGTSNSIPRLVNGDISWTDFSDLYLEDGDFLRIANITLGYDFASLLNLKAISQARLYFQVQNLYTFTNYSGMDPEVGYGQDAWVSGIDTGTYPHSRTFLVGVNLKF
ncbi:SusC/RagA family TonB-linked outer membrane protein [Prevotella sp. AGR2160]|uniref:SusC/RagA family TonB-linked outer membrane protein n=1 Tax=Prevotella sp. AGR2160 TaxID=1280674 RepID=UPI0003FEAFBE|nr:TonB-dependent receptor [Prevotella sp. AGR2160]